MFKDSEDIEHTVEVEARTLYEAVGLAIERFRHCDHVKYEPQGLHEFTVESREPGTQHRLTRKRFDARLDRAFAVMCSPMSLSIWGVVAN